MPPRAIGLLLLACLTVALPAGLAAAITAEHQKQIAEIRKELNKVQSLVTKKEADEAEKILADCEQKLKQIAKDASVDENHKLIAGLFKQIEAKKATLSKRQPAADGKGGGVSFEKDVAPILVARCLSCHGENNPRANLRLATFAGITQGCGGRLVVPGNPQASMLVARITATGEQRMPRNGDPLSADEIRKITAWIAAGAKFAGTNSTPLAELIKSEEKKKQESTPVTINKPTGGERVSFVRDIAPFMVNLCLDCHSGNGRGMEQTGFSLESFERLMRGGRSGRVVVPGNTKESRLWQLAGEQDPIKMPPGQSVMKRSNHTNLRIWIEEGAKFDGTDAQVRAPLRSLVPTEAELRTRELATLTSEDWIVRRRQGAKKSWQAALGKEEPAEHDTEGFIVLGNASESRLKQIGEWASEDAKMLKKLFAIKEAQIWRGKLVVFVFKDRFSYAEFVLTNEKTELPSEVKGHARVTPAQDEAFIGLQDDGDDSDDESPGTRALLLDLLTEALLQRSATKVPEWAARGLGLALAARNDPKNPYFRGLGGTAHAAVAALEKPQDLFASGAFAPDDLGPVGYTLVSHMMKQGGEARFVQFIGQLTGGKTLAEALKMTYSAEPESLARSYLVSLGSLRPAPKKSAKPK